jgi:hypothetical protein
MLFVQTDAKLATSNSVISGSPAPPILAALEGCVAEWTRPAEWVDDGSFSFRIRFKTSLLGRKSDVKLCLVRINRFLI